MAKINMVPEFTEDSPSSETGQEVSELSSESTISEEEVAKRETLSEPPAEETSAQEKNLEGGDTGELEKEVSGLREERSKLIEQIVALRGERRELKQKELEHIESQIDDLKDLNPDDVNIIDRILRAKGYMTKEEVARIDYNSIKQSELNKFLDEYPEYKRENDKNDLKWGPLSEEVILYREPIDPKMWGEYLRKAHRLISGRTVSSDRSSSVKKRQVELAGVGAGGTQRSSSHKSLDADQRAALEAGGWSKEDIKRIEERLT